MTEDWRPELGNWLHARGAHKAHEQGVVSNAPNNEEAQIPTSGLSETERNLFTLPSCLVHDEIAAALGWAWRHEHARPGAVRTYTAEERAAFAAARGLAVSGDK